MLSMSHKSARTAIRSIRTLSEILVKMASTFESSFTQKQKKNGTYAKK